MNLKQMNVKFCIDCVKIMFYDRYYNDIVGEI
jgi:hypothetical protein